MTKPLCQTCTWTRCIGKDNRLVACGGWRLIKPWQKRLGTFKRTAQKLLQKDKHNFTMVIHRDMLKDILKGLEQ